MGREVNRFRRMARPVAPPGAMSMLPVKIHRQYHTENPAIVPSLFLLFLSYPFHSFPDNSENTLFQYSKMPDTRQRGDSSRPLVPLLFLFFSAFPLVPQDLRDLFDHLVLLQPELDLHPPGSVHVHLKLRSRSLCGIHRVAEGTAVDRQHLLEPGDLRLV